MLSKAGGQLCFRLCAAPYACRTQVSQHPGVTAAIGVVQASLKRHSPHLKKACVEAASAHLTLGVMALNSEAEQARAVDVLAGLAEPLREAKLLAPVTVQLEGLSHFKNQVRRLGA